ncbi:MAG: ATP-dependent zinc protease [Desulfobacterium sp.]|nr:ATP-dependent zinc protease [Desulfobacterium sp.]
MFQNRQYCRIYFKQTRAFGAGFTAVALTILLFSLAILSGGCTHLEPAPKPSGQHTPVEILKAKEKTPVPVIKKQAKKKQTKKKRPKPSPEIHGRRYIIGEVEPVMIKQAGFTLPARIDTGATTSSLSAADITPYERDGKKWVSFTVKSSDSSKIKQMKRPVSRTVRIKTHVSKSRSQYVVKLRTVLGHIEQVRDFTLTDRSNFKYPVLIGRNFLDGIFLVDVSLKNSTSPFSEKQNNEK